MVFGTNPLALPLLRINPFSFHDSIHVLEHIDRLIEIFNACWPMYAAMPAVLKDVVERCYLEKGWDLNNSCCAPLTFPTMFDLMDMLPRVMDESLYSSDTKSDFSGALITRVKSLRQYRTMQRKHDENIHSKQNAVDNPSFWLAMAH